MASFWDTLKVFATIIGGLALCGAVVAAAICTPSIVSVAFALALGGVVIVGLWFVASWLAFIGGLDF